VVLPPVVPSWAGGGRSPRVLSEWRVGALKACHILRTKGLITRAELAALGQTAKSWVGQGWLVSEKTATGWIYRPTKLSLLPDAGYEKERDAIANLK
jgi:hypothetical protein